MTEQRKFIIVDAETGNKADEFKTLKEAVQNLKDTFANDREEYQNKNDYCFWLIVEIYQDREISRYSWDGELC